MGWRYTIITLSAVSVAFGVIRIFIFKIPESPCYLLSKSLDSRAVEAVNYTSHFNKKPETLTLDMFWAIDEKLGITSDANNRPVRKCGKTAFLVNTEITRRKLKSYTVFGYRKLFTSRKK
ncbi:hypothetical protein PISL3812_00079 [Talaromyces islandicus]|uniref:Major facilitator superfamily (MFS) profile domain-containing protein n=1 Tax=Talaromyces islandicus TaxID=28573 RepID=A0A0U1LI95_TALIS|nr:hypothetical protein PISL3812_00079 [Talaromyces islandicus]